MKKLTAQQLRCYFIAGTQDMFSDNARLQTVNARIKALLTTLEEALAAGIGCFQFREKGAKALQHKGERKKLAQAAQQLCQSYDVPFLINDDWQLACEIGADGIHVGQSDIAITTLIEHLAKDKTYHPLIGLSVRTRAQALAVNHLSAISYWGVGPVFTTVSKQDAKSPVGIERIQQLCALKPRPPIVAIGGITIDNVRQVYAAGADGVAVISALIGCPNMAVSVAQLKNDD